MRAQIRTRLRGDIRTFLGPGKSAKTPPSNCSCGASSQAAAARVSGVSCCGTRAKPGATQGAGTSTTLFRNSSRNSSWRDMRRGQLAQQIVAVLVLAERTDPIPEALRGEHPPPVSETSPKPWTKKRLTRERELQEFPGWSPARGTCRARAPRRGNAAPGHRAPRPARSRCPRLRPPLRKRRRPSGGTR